MHSVPSQEKTGRWAFLLAFSLLVSVIAIVVFYSPIELVGVCLFSTTKLGGSLLHNKRQLIKSGSASSLQMFCKNPIKSNPKRLLGVVPVVPLL